ncbi:MAG: hypothetical protein ABL890_02825 [Candidatus Peribacteraceae bacterium]
MPISESPAEDADFGQCIREAADMTLSPDNLSEVFKSWEFLCGWAADAASLRGDVSAARNLLEGLNLIGSQRKELQEFSFFLPLSITSIISGQGALPAFPSTIFEKQQLELIGKLCFAIASAYIATHQDSVTEITSHASGYLPSHEIAEIMEESGADPLAVITLASALEATYGQRMKQALFGI